MGLKNTYQTRKRFTKVPVSKTGMWYQDRDVVVPSNQITMKGPNGEPNYFNSPIMGTGMQSGQTQVMYPGREYSFPNDNSVYETKMQGGGISGNSELALDLASMIPGPVGMMASGLGLFNDLYQGDWVGAGLNTANILTGGTSKGLMSVARLASNAGARNAANVLAAGSRNLNRTSRIVNNYTKPVDTTRNVLNPSATYSTEFGGYEDNNRKNIPTRPDWYTTEDWDRSVDQYNFKNRSKMQEGGNVDPEFMFKNKYNTELTPSETADFSKWAAKESQRQGRDILNDMGAYDVKGFWKSGDYKNMDSDNHGTDTWKKPNHPTFSNQSRYHGADGWYGGNWTDKAGYQPSKQTLETYGPEYYDWMFKSEPGRSEYLDMSRYESGLNKPTPFVYQKGGWLKSYQDAGEVSTANNPVKMNPIDIQAPQRSWFDRNIERPLRKFGRSYAQRISNATGGSEWYKQPNSVASAFFSTGPGFTLEAPQLSATYAVTGKVQTPSEAMNIQNPYGAFAVDMILDPIGAPSTAKGLVNLGRNLPKKLMRSAEIPKVSSVDDVVDLYRVQERNAKTFQQLADEGKLNKAFNNPQTLARKAEEEKYFGQWFTNNKKDLDFYIADREFLDPEIINLKIPRSELSKYSNYDKTLSRAPDREFVIPLSEQQKYINTPKNSFKSEIDWGKWNVDTPKYPELMNEYNTIEESTKKAGTWMKNPDGSSFQGTPEQFVQQQSSYFKKAFPSVLKDDANNVQFTYHGSPSEFDFFDGSIINHGRTRGHGIYTTPEVEKATGYAKGPNGKVYQLYQNAANKQDEYFKLKQASDEKFKQFLKDNPKDSPGFDKKFDDFVKEDGKTFDHLSIDEFKLRNGFDFYIAEPDEYVVPFTNYPKSAKGNVGFFDMTNPNIYKAVAPVGVGLGAGASQLQEKKYGGLQMSYLKTKRFK